MKKWLYFIVPVIALVVFLFFYFSHVKEAEIRAAERKAQIERVAAEEAAKKAALEERARQDAAKKAAERAADEAKKEAERQAKWNAQGQKIQDETNEALAKCSDYTAKIAAATSDLSDLRRKRDQANQDLMETARELESLKVARRAAEMEVQRITDLIVRKAESSALAVPPPVPVKTEKSND